MNIEWIEDFLVLCKTMKFSQAAAIRNVTQPTFSRRIQNLETWFGMPLVDRSTFPAGLTEEGRNFRKTAEEAVQMLYRERDFSRGLIRNHRSFLTFSTLHTLAISFYPDWIAGIERETGPIQARMICAPLHDCVAGLTSGACDFMLSYFHPSGPLVLDEEQYPSLRIGRESLVPISAPDEEGKPLHNLDAPGSKSVAYLNYSPHTFTIKVIDKILSQQDTVPVLNTVYESALTMSLKSMALKGSGLAWLPETAVAAELLSGALVPGGSKAWTAPMDICIYRSANSATRMSERLWKVLRAEAA